MARFLILAVALVGCVVADDSGYAAPSGGYAQPAVSSGYGAPQDTYAQPSYEPSAPSYETSGVSYEAEGGDLFKFDKLVELIPFFLAVFAAIIVAQLFAPLLGMLFDVKVGLLAPFGCAKRDLINMVLAPLDLAICDISVPAAPTTTCTAKRSFNDQSYATGFFSNPQVLNLVQNTLTSALESKLLFHDLHFEF